MKKYLPITCALITILLFGASTSPNKKSSYHIDNEIDTTAIIQLGRHLFYDKRLSANGTKSCSSCHDQRFAFTDGYRKSIGIYGENVRHNSQPIFNLLFNQSLTWWNPTLEYAIQQIKIPMYGDTPHEMGIKGFEEKILVELWNDSLYHKLMKNAFYTSKRFDLDQILLSLSFFCESIESFNSDWDNEILTASELRGQDLFYSDSLNCTKCHLGMNMNHNRDGEQIIDNYWNIGLYNVNDKGDYPPDDLGLFELTKKQEDMGRFRTPSLRNLGFTAPYFHDGSAETLSEVIDIYMRGGRTVTYGNCQGDGKLNPYKSKEIKTFSLSKTEKADLIDFLLCLNDSTLVSNPKYSNPFPE